MTEVFRLSKKGVERLSKIEPTELVDPTFESRLLDDEGLARLNDRLNAQLNASLVVVEEAPEGSISALFWSKMKEWLSR